MHNEMLDVSQFRAFGCWAWVYLDADSREKGKHTASAVEAINLGLNPNRSSYCFFIPEKDNLMTSNQARFDEFSFPFRKQKMVEQFQSDNSTDMLYINLSEVKWIPGPIPFNKLHITNYTRVHYDSTSDVVVACSR